MILRLPLAIALFASLASSIQAADEKAGIEFFEKHIRPVLVSKCYECHSSSSKEPKGNLLLDPSIPNLLVTPHVAWASSGAKQALADELIDVLEAWARGAPVNRLA